MAHRDADNHTLKPHLLLFELDRLLVAAEHMRILGWGDFKRGSLSYHDIIALSGNGMSLSSLSTIMAAVLFGGLEGSDLWEPH